MAPEGRALGRFVSLWHLSRPRLWMVSVLPGYTGWLLASQELLPASVRLSGAIAGRDLGRALDALLAGVDLYLALVVLGPLLGTASLLINDAHDLANDRGNPRKQASPLVQGRVSVAWVSQAAHVTALVALVAAGWISTPFLLLVAGCLVLAWAYSVPPVRLKARPGADLAVNAMGVGLLAGLAGWSLAAPLEAFPFAYIPQGLLVAAAIYVPTTLVDMEADRRAGDRTLATHLGEQRAYGIGFGAWIAANLGALVLAAMGVLLPRAMVPVLVVSVPVLVWSYHQWIGQAAGPGERVRGIFGCAILFLAVNLVFALLYTGVIG